VIAVEITDEDILDALSRNRKEGISDRVKIIKSDATRMPFPSARFNHCVNFLGWEDLTAISGLIGVNQVMDEIVRVLRPEGRVWLTFTPQITGNDVISKNDRELDDFIYIGERRRIYFDEKYFVDLLESRGLNVIETRDFTSEQRRIKPESAKGIFRWLCDNYKSFYPQVQLRSYQDIMKKYGEFIDKYGIREPMCQIRLLVAGKS
jgi:ubiquinone/menaquinone biosynthesis C-methylase UbiE